MKILDVWVAALIALASIATCVLVYLATGTKWQIGSLGEWVSGLGSLGAVIVAILVAARQQRLAQEQFRQERAHASEMADDERRYQTTLQSAASHAADRQAKLHEYQTAKFLLHRVARGMHLALGGMDHILEQPALHQSAAALIIEARNYQVADKAALSVGPTTFQTPNLAEAFEDVVFYWGQVATTYALLNVRKLDGESIREMALEREAIVSSVEACAKALLLSHPDAELSLDKAAASARSWTEMMFS